MKCKAEECDRACMDQFVEYCSPHLEGVTLARDLATKFGMADVLHDKAKVKIGIALGDYLRLRDIPDPIDPFCG